jgi:hypothetical protein
MTSMSKRERLYLKVAFVVSRSGRCASREGWRDLWESIPPGYESEPGSYGAQL